MHACSSEADSLGDHDMGQRQESDTLAAMTALTYLTVAASSATDTDTRCRQDGSTGGLQADSSWSAGRQAGLVTATDMAAMVVMTHV